jgi:hypothetical protein
MLSDTQRVTAIKTICEPGDMTAYRITVTPFHHEAGSWYEVSTQFNGPIPFSAKESVAYVKRIQEKEIEGTSPEMYNDNFIDYVRAHNAGGDLIPWTAIAMVKTVAELYLMGEIK